MLSYICRTLLANKCWLAILGLTLTVYFNDDLFAWIEPLDSNIHEHHLGDRMKRNVDPVAHEQASSGESIRLARRILNESESFVEKDGKKVPIDLKSLNKDYVEARKRFYAPPPACRNRTAAPPPPAPGAGPPAPPPPPAEGEAPAEGDAPAAPEAPPAEAEAPPPPGDRRRRKREAKELPYCDELNKNPTAAPGAAPPAPAEVESPAAAPPPPVEGEAPAAAPDGDAPPPAAD